MIVEIVIIGIAAFIIWKLVKKIEEIRIHLKKAHSETRSAYVKFGKSFEHFVPFIKNFPGDRQKAVFMGNYIDFICFDDDAIKFIEVKTGQSQLNNNQKRIKKLILDKRVEWHELRY